MSASARMPDPDAKDQIRRYADAAHEARTPITLALEAARALDDDTRLLEEALAGMPLPDEASDLLRRIAGAAAALEPGLAHAARLLGAVTRSAAEHARGPAADGATLEPVSLVDTLEDALALVGPALRRARLRTDLRVAPGAPERARIDAVALEQAVVDLVENASRHAYAGALAGRIDVELEAGAPGEAAVRVRDFGRGIEPRHVARVFDDGFTTARDAGGTGLGLGLVRRLVRERLRGDVTVESAPGKGSAFTIRFPVS